MSSQNLVIQFVGLACNSINDSRLKISTLPPDITNQLQRSTSPLPMHSGASGWSSAKAVVKGRLVCARNDIGMLGGTLKTS